MRWGYVACLLAGCTFTSRLGDVEDAAPPDTPPPDSASGRSTLGLVGFWTFDETSGIVAADTAGDTPAVDLSVAPSPATMVAWGNGTLTVSMPAIIESATQPHYDKEIVTQGAVTLEAWILPAAASQGIPRAAVITGLCFNATTTNISLLQSGTKWAARVRTSADGSGGPVLVSTSDVSIAGMTHLVLTADATERALYINGVKEAETAPAPPTGWGTYPVVLANPSRGGAPWLGTFAMVALYERRLAPAEIAGNFAAGPDAR